MRWLSQLHMRFLMLFKRTDAASSLDNELRFHIDRQIAENLAAGMGPEEARFAAIRAFGNPALLRDQTRVTWSWNSLESLLRDVRYSIRTLRRTPGFTAIAIVIIALGIGANVTLFTVVRSVLLKPLPFPEQERLMMIYEQPKDHPEAFNSVAGGIYAEWRDQNRTFSDLAIMNRGQLSLSGDGGQLPENVGGLACSWNLMKTLGVQPAFGRDFNSADDNPSANGTVILSWSLWQRRYGGNPAIVSKIIHVNGNPYTVIGILPAWLDFPSARTQIWTPVYHAMPAKTMSAISSHQFEVVGRLNAGVSGKQALEDLSMISLRIHNAHLNDPFVQPGAKGRPLLEDQVGSLRQPLYILLVATGCLLLIACLNVANLMVARTAARSRELAIRSALGGGRWRLLREMLMESLLLSAAGGAAGIALAFAGVEWLIRTRQDMSRVQNVHIDTVVALFAVGLILFCALSSGLISGWSACGKQVLTTLSESSRSVSASRGRTTLRKALLSVEVGLTVLLLIGSGLLLKSYQRLRFLDLGCVTQDVLRMQLFLPEGRYNSPALRAGFYGKLLTQVRALPGVEAAGLVSVLPGQGYGGDWGFKIAEHPPLPQGTGQTAINRWIDPGYFASIGIPILRGRTFSNNQQLDNGNEVVVSQAFVQRYLPGEEPLGKHVRPTAFDKDFTIVGVVGDVRVDSRPPQPMQYYPISIGRAGSANLVIRSTGDVTQLALPAQRAIQKLDHDMPVSDVMTMEQLRGKTTVDASFNATLLTAFAVLSLLLAAVGLFGVLSYVVAQRTSEIGIRIALGAQREHVLRKVLFDGMRPALFGLAFGLAASAAAVRLLRSMLYQTQPLDPAVFTVVAATLLCVAVLACLVPAWRASRLDPMQALRTE
jgi:predicted permease